MFNGRSIEFFEADGTRLSMTRLLMFLSFFPASYVVCCKPDGDTLAWFLAAYSASYVGGKFADAKSGTGPQSIEKTTTTEKTVITPPQTTNMDVKAENVTVSKE